MGTGYYCICEWWISNVKKSMPRTSIFYVVGQRCVRAQWFSRESDLCSHTGLHAQSGTPQLVF